MMSDANTLIQALLLLAASSWLIFRFLWPLARAAYAKLRRTRLTVL